MTSPRSRTLLPFAVAGLAALALAGCGSSPSAGDAVSSVPAGGRASATTASSPTEAATAAAATATSAGAPVPTAADGTVSCEYPASGAAAKPVDPPTAGKVQASGSVSVTLTIDGSPVVITMDRAKAPCTVHNFESLAKQGWFNDTKCHRLVNAGIFVLQCGDPTGTGLGGPGYTFADELAAAKALPAGSTSDSVDYTKGTVAMANGGPDTNGSQFFLVYQDSTLKPAYTVFGQMDAASVGVEKIAAQGVGSDGVTPKAPAKISTVTLG